MHTSRFLQAVLPLGLLSTASCVGAFDDVAVLSPVARAVELSTATPTGCKSRGDVFGQSKAEGDPEAAVRGARNDIRNRAASLGANYVVIQTTAEDRSLGMWTPTKVISLSGVAYHCPSSPAASPPPMEPD